MIVKLIVVSNLIALYFLLHAPLVGCSDQLCFLNGSFVKHLPLMEPLSKIIEAQSFVGG